MNLVSMPISQLAAVRSGGGAPQDPAAFAMTGHPFVRAGSLPKLLNGAKEESLELIEPDVADEYRLRLFPAGTVLFAKSGMSATKGHVYRLRKPAYVVNHLAALVPHDPNDSEFLAHALQRYSPTILIKDPAYPSIRLGDIENMKIKAPESPDDRARIADILDKANELRVKRRAALAQLDTLTQSVFLDMFGDPATNPMGWQEDKLGACISVGPQNGLYKPASDYGSGTPILRIDAFYDGVVTGLRELKRLRVSEEEKDLYGLQAGQIVINRVNSREYLGKSALIPPLPEPVVFESNMMRFGVDLKRLDPVFLIEHLQTKHVRGHILQSAKDAVNQSSINQQDVKSIPLFLPPLPMQQLFARRVTARQKLLIKQNTSLAELENLLASLRHRTFRGEL